MRFRRTQESGNPRKNATDERRKIYRRQTNRSQRVRQAQAKTEKKDQRKKKEFKINNK